MATKLQPKNYLIYQGTRAEIKLTSHSKLTDETVFFTAKTEYDYDRTDSKAAMKKDITAHTDDYHTILVLTPDDTFVPAGKYKYDVKFKDSIVMRGTITIYATSTGRG